MFFLLICVDATVSTSWVFIPSHRLFNWWYTCCQLISTENALSILMLDKGLPMHEPKCKSRGSKEVKTKKKNSRFYVNLKILMWLNIIIFRGGRMLPCIHIHLSISTHGCVSVCVQKNQKSSKLRNYRPAVWCAYTVEWRAWNSQL